MSAMALFGQLLLGLINGSFYAMLSLGLAIVFGLLGIVNAAQGAFYMLGAFFAWMLGSISRHRLLAGAAAGAARRSRCSACCSNARIITRVYNLDHLYGLLLTLGLFQIIQGLFVYWYGTSGQPYDNPPSALTGGHNLGFMFMPNYRAWVVVASLILCFGTWYAIEKTRLGAYLRAATENPTLVRAFGINVPLLVTLAFGGGVALAGRCRRAGGADLSGQSADGRQHPHHRVRGRGDRRLRLDPRLDRHRAGARRARGLLESVLSRSLEHGDLRDHDRGADGRSRKACSGGRGRWRSKSAASRRARSKSARLSNGLAIGDRRRHPDRRAVRGLSACS